MLQRNRNRCQRIRDVVPAQQRQCGVFAIALHQEVESGTEGAAGLNIFRTDVGGGDRAVEHNFSFEVAAELRDVFVIRIQDSGAALR